MYCLDEHKPVAATKNRWSWKTGLFTAGPTGWICPTCGGKAVHKNSILAKRARKQATA